MPQKDTITQDQPPLRGLLAGLLAGLTVLLAVAHLAAGSRMLVLDEHEGSVEHHKGALVAAGPEQPGQKVRSNETVKEKLEDEEQQAGKATLLHDRLEVPTLSQDAKECYHKILQAANIRYEEDADPIEYMRKAREALVKSNSSDYRVYPKGAPFGGLGFVNREIGELKLSAFQAMAEGKTSMYVWTLHPIYDTYDHLVGFEILLRMRNGGYGAPYEDIRALAQQKPEVYRQWKLAEVFRFGLGAIRKLHEAGFEDVYVSTNLLPSQLNPKSPFSSAFMAKWNTLPNDQKALLERVVVEVVPHQVYVGNTLKDRITFWRGRFNMRFMLDDVVAPEAVREQMVGTAEKTFHTEEALKVLIPTADQQPDAELVYGVKVPYNYAKFLFGVPDKWSKYKAFDRDETLSEFAAWCLKLINENPRLLIILEYSLNPRSHKERLELTRKYELNIFGEKHRDRFRFQGGPRAEHAFELEQLISAIVRTKDVETFLQNVVKGNSAIVGQTLKKNPKLANARLGYKPTALMQAIALIREVDDEHFTIAELLLKHGASITAEANGETVLKLARNLDLPLSTKVGELLQPVTDDKPDAKGRPAP